MRLKDHYKASRAVSAVVLSVLSLLWVGKTEAQWLEGFSHRATITIDPNIVPDGDSLEDFPFLFSWSDTLLKSASYGGMVSFSDGMDISFTGDDYLTVLDFEIESYDPEEGSVTAWIRIPELSSDSETELFLYYGNPAGIPLQDTNGVWSNQYVSVWHMHNDPSGDAPQVTDATSSLNHGTTGGNMSEDDLMDGKIAKGIHFDGVDDYAIMPVNGFNLPEGTVELWINLDSISDTGSDYFFAHRQEDPITDRVYLRVWPNGEWGTGMGSTYDLARGNSLDTGSWHHLAITWEGEEFIGYLDGAQDISPVSYTELDIIREIYIMTWMPSSESASGILDELRVSGAARDSAWIATSYLNQFQPESFYQVKAQPANDLPCDAIELTESESCDFLEYTNIDATGSAIPDPGCGSYAGGDIWFMVIVPADGSFEIQTFTEAEAQFPDNEGWMYRAAMGLYEGSCDALTLLGCYENNGLYHPRMAGASVTGKIPGDTIWIRIWENSNNDIGKIKICVADTIEIAPQCPLPFNVTGGGSYFQGDTGVSVGLSGSEVNMQYTLLLNDTIRLDTLPGSGEILTWTPLLTEGIYKVEGEYVPDACVVLMNDSAVVTVLDDPDLFTVSGGGSYCTGDTGVSVVLSGSDPGIKYTLLLNGTIRLDTLTGNGTSLTWSPVSLDGWYSVEAENPADSSIMMMNDSTSVAILELPQITWEAVSILCGGDDDGSISLSVTAIPPLIIEWTGSGGYFSSEQDISELPPGEYTVTVTDSNHCVSVSPAIEITESPQLMATVEKVMNLTSYEADDGAVDLSITGGTPPYTVSWTGTDGFVSADQDPAGMTVGYYDVFVTDDHQCTESVEKIIVTVEEDSSGVFIPDGFSPNGDGYNDRFVILGIENHPDNELMVFNRQGVTVLHRVNYENNWDGKPEKGGVLGGELPEGTYYYIFRFGESGIRKGYVYINRE